jgi:hypothetical protein
LLTIVDRLVEAAERAGGSPPAPRVPEIPGITECRGCTGNDLLAELSARHDELKPLLAQWQAAKAEKEIRLRAWELATRLAALGARGQQGALDAIRNARNLRCDKGCDDPSGHSGASLTGFAQRDRRARGRHGDDPEPGPTEH